MGWLTNLLKNALAQAATEVLLPQMEARFRTIVQEEVRRQFEEIWMPRIHQMVQEEMRRQFEEVWMPRIETQTRQIVREEIQKQFEEVWLPKLQAMWREDLFSETRSIHNRIDALTTMIVQYTQLRTEEIREILSEVRSLRSEVERIKAHVGLS